MLQTGKSLPEIELACRDVRSGAASDTLQLLQTTLHEMRLANAGCAVQQKVPLFTSELQSQLLDVGFAFTENLDSWQKVGWGSGALVEEDTFLLLDGGFAIEHPEHLAFPARTLHEAAAVEGQPLTGAVQRFARGLQQSALRFLGHGARRL